MKILYFPIVILFCLSMASCQNIENSHSSNAEPVLFGDPFIMFHKDTYYAYGTNSKNGIEVYTSDNLKYWEKAAALALHKDDSWGERWFWAPEVYYIKEKNKFYMYYSADEHICVAMSDSPLGPFRQEEKQPMIADEKCVDSSLFIDDDGTPYLYFDRYNDGLNVWVVELENDYKTIRQNSLTRCINVSQAWEEVWPRTNDGASVIKNKNVYYMTYSANNYQSVFQGIGYATSSSPTGPWKKYENNPILQNPDSLVGVGHSSIFKDKEGRMRMAFHAHNSREKVHPRIMYIANVKFTDEPIPVLKITGNIIKPSLLN